MNTETIAPWRSSAEEIFFAFVCLPLTAGLFSVDHRESTAPCMFGNHTTGGAPGATGAAFDWK